MIWYLLPVAILFILRFIPIRCITLIEGKFLHRNPAWKTYTVKYYFKNYCRSCLEGNPRRGGSVWNCYVTTPSQIITIGDEPKENESVKLISFYNIYGMMVIAWWQKTHFQINPLKFDFLKKQLESRQINFHS